MSNVSPIPEGFRTVTPHLIIKGASDAIEFYKKAFGAEETMRMTGPGNSIMHAELKIGNSMVMIADEWPENGNLFAPASLDNKTTFAMALYVEDVDAAFARAVEAGATVVYPVEDAFWGDRYGKVVDAWGHTWELMCHIEDVSVEECQRRAAEIFGAQQS